jgi:hypothetical protein
MRIARIDQRFSAMRRTLLVAVLVCTGGAAGVLLVAIALGAGSNSNYEIVLDLDARVLPGIGTTVADPDAARGNAHLRCDFQQPQPDGIDLCFRPLRARQTQPPQGFVRRGLDGPALLKKKKEKTLSRTSRGSRSLAERCFLTGLKTNEGHNGRKAIQQKELMNRNPESSQNLLLVRKGG